MPHILFAAPSLGSFHLHDRLADLAMRRGHRITILVALPEDEAFWRAQGLPTRRVCPAGQPLVDPALPWRELAAQDARLHGTVRTSEARQARSIRGLELLAAGVQRELARDRPDVVLVHAGRSALHRLVYTLAQRVGTPTLHVGDGFLPGTLLCDLHGVDGDSSLCTRTAVDYRGTRADPALLRAAHAAWLGGAVAPAALRRPPVAPPWPDRLAAAVATGLRSGPRRARAAWNAWRAAERCTVHEPARHAPSPADADRPMAVSGSTHLPTPLLAVLLQPDACPRVRLDAPAGSSALAAMQATQAAATRLDPRPVVVGVLPDVPIPRELRLLAQHGHRVVPHSMAAAATAIAVAVVTINHPHAGGALLHGTPVVHFGRAGYAIPGVAVATSAADLPRALASALASERPALRERFLTRVLARNHVWCAADAPDPNGLRGLLLRLELLAGEKTVSAGRIAYRPGPAWPLAVTP